MYVDKNSDEWIQLVLILVTRLLKTNGDVLSDCSMICNGLTFKCHNV